MCVGGKCLQFSVTGQELEWFYLKQNKTKLKGNAKQY